MIKVGVLGARGRMGAAVCEAIEDADGVELAAQVDQGDPLDALIGCDVAVDFTHVGVVMDNLRWCVEHGLNVVVGTSGFGAERLAEVRAWLEKTASVRVLIAPNFSVGAVLMMALGLALMSLTYGPLGTLISELFPTPVRYTGSSLAFSLAGILGASLAPYIATWLATNLGLQYVGYYLSASAVLTLIGLLSIRETKDDDLTTEQSRSHAAADSLATESTSSPRRRTAVL